MGEETWKPASLLAVERRRRGWSQAIVVDRMYHAARFHNLPAPRGLNVNYVSKWERGINQPDRHHVHLLCLVFELPSDRLGLPGDTSPPMSPDVSNSVRVEPSLQAANHFADDPATIANRPMTPAERSVLTEMIGYHIESAWALFHTADTDRMYPIARTQLHLLHRHSADIDTHMLPVFYSAVYRLIGATHHRRGEYQQALQAHQSSYFAALEAADPWSMAQCKSWQAYGMQALGRYDDALQITEAALRVISERDDPSSVRLRGRLLTSGAMNAAILRDENRSTAMLQSSEPLLHQLGARNEEFDRAVWLESAGVCTLRLGQPSLAVAQFQQALDATPEQWISRRVLTTIGLAIALTRTGDLEAALAASGSLVPQVRALRSRELTDHFVDCVRTELLKQLPRNQNAIALIAQAESAPDYA